MITNNIYFLSYSKLTNKIVEEYSLDLLVNEKVFIEYIDLTNLLRKSHVDNGMTNRIKHVKINTYLELFLYLKKNKSLNSIFFTNIPFQLQFLWFHIIISYFKIDTWSIMNFGNPVYNIKRKISEKLLSHLLRPHRFLKIFLNNTFLFLLLKIKFLRKNSLTFCVGLAEFNKNHYTKKKVSLNSLDYEKAKSLKIYNIIYIIY